MPTSLPGWSESRRGPWPGMPLESATPDCLPPPVALASVFPAEQFQSLARILAGDQVHFLEHAQRPQRDVFQIPDGRGDKIQ